MRRLSSSGLRRDCSRLYVASTSAIGPASVPPKFSAAYRWNQSPILSSGSLSGAHA